MASLMSAYQYETTTIYLSGNGLTFKVEGDVTVKEGNHFDLCTELPFPDDTIMREVLCNGRKIIKVNPIG